MTQSKLPTFPADDAADLLGNTTSSAGATFVSALGFNGERRSNLLGGYHLGNGYRVYNPALRRFNSPDSMSPFGAGGINPYAYCEGDPINRTDPTGHVSFDPSNMVLQSFEKRDLLYGLSDSRVNYSIELPDLFRFADTQVYPCTIDQYPLNDSQLEEMSAGRYPIAHKLDMQSFHQSINEHQKYSSILRDEDMDYYIRTGHKCKAGLNWAMKDDRHVHFVLDNIDEEYVTNFVKDPERTTKYKSFTSRELRWLYRNRENEKFHQSISFLREGQRVAPPWETNVSGWAKYEKKIQKKRTEKLMREKYSSQAIQTTPRRSLVGRVEHSLETILEDSEDVDFFLL